MTIQAFVSSPQKHRMLELLGSPKKRKKLVAMLNHFDALDERYASRIDPSTHTAEAVGTLLRGAGAPNLCVAMSSNPEIDDRELSLDEALAASIDGDYGTFLTCIPGRLAYYQGEGISRRFLLTRP